MNRQKAFLMAATLGLVMGAGASTSLAQVAGFGEVVRTPGQMVFNGAIRVQQFRESAANVTIPQAPAEPSVWAQAAADSITILFDRLNLVIVAMRNVMRAQHGLAPVIPASILPGGTNGASGAGDLDLSGLDLSGVDLSGLLDTFGT